MRTRGTFGLALAGSSPAQLNVGYGQWAPDNRRMEGYRPVAAVDDHCEARQNQRKQQPAQDAQEGGGVMTRWVGRVVGHAATSSIFDAARRASQV